jgi:hypothetical protein
MLLISGYLGSDVIEMRFGAFRDGRTEAAASH